MKVVFLFPNTNSARALAVRLIELGHTVSVFCRDELDIKNAKNIIAELSIVGSEQDRLRGVTNSFTVLRTCRFSDFQILVVPSIDVLSKKSDREYAVMCGNMFKCMKEEGCRFSTEAHIVFGWNFGGLIAANEWGKIFPDSRKQILVTSSIFLASYKCYGAECETRAFPIARSQVKVANTTGEQLKQIQSVEYNWDLDNFPILEQKAMWQVLEPLVKGRNLESIEILGRYPTEAEAKDYNIPLDIPVWLPVKDENIPWFKQFFINNKQHFTGYDSHSAE